VITITITDQYYY